MSGPDWYRWYPAKWASGVIGLSPEQRGVYMDIINITLDRGSCPEDYGYLAKACGCNRQRITRVVGELIEHGKLIRDDGKLVSNRAVTERKVSENFTESQRNRVSKRWKNNALDDTGAYTNHNHNHKIQSTALPSELTDENPESRSEGGVGETSSPSRAMPAPQAAPSGPRLDSRKASSKPEPNGHDPPGRHPRGSRLDEAWTPGEEGVAYAMTELGQDAEVVNETWNYFRDYWLAKAGAGARKTSWQLAWKTWVRRARDELRERNRREERYRNGQGRR